MLRAKVIYFSVFLLIIAFTLLLGTSSSAQIDNFRFDKNLKRGMRSNDVLRLQMMLNEDPDTLLASVGAGSPGNETTFFGSKTFNAVLRFQEKYKSEVLTPINLTRATGFVGPMTRRKLNSLIEEKNNPTTPPVSINPPVIPPIAPPPPPESVDIYATDRRINEVQNELNDKLAEFIQSGEQPVIDEAELNRGLELLINAPSSYSGAPGDRVSIAGVGFDFNENTIHFGENYSVESEKSFFQGQTSFIVPNIPFGRYDLALSNKNGVTNTIFFIVTNEAIPEVKVESVTPENVKFGESITVIGSGFTPTDNEIQTNVGDFTGLVSPDGKTLTIDVAPELVRPALGTPNASEFDMQISVFVVNQNGYTKEPVFFNLKLE